MLVYVFYFFVLGKTTERYFLVLWAIKQRGSTSVLNCLYIFCNLTNYAMGLTLQANYSHSICELLM